MAEAIKNRYEFVILFDVENGNPNGDPDAGNMPRTDPETGCGLVTAVCLKRKIRNYVETIKEDEAGYRIYVKDGVPLNRSDAEACAYLNVASDEKALKKAKKDDPELDRKLRDWMCANFFDIRTFGAAGLCQERRSHCAPGSDHYPCGNHNRGGCGEKGHGNGPKVHRSLWPLPLRGLYFRQSGQKDHRVYRGGFDAPVDGNSQYV